MQRLFSMFPTGRPGIALIFLRLALSVMLLHGMAAYAFGSGLTTLLLPITAIVAIALTLGFLTPIACLLAIAIAVIRFIDARGYFEAIQVCATLDAVSLGLMGPGSYSMDALLFGRRRIRLSGGPDREDRRASSGSAVDR